MALQLNVSNSLNSLADKLTEALKYPSDVFRPFYIVTQTDGMNNWLKNHIANELGIAANIRFLKPNDLIRQLYFLLDGQRRKTIPEEGFTWLLYNILGEKDLANRFPLLAGYLDASGREKDLKRLSLAQKMTDLYDQYQIYRPEMMMEWNSHKLEEVTGNDWQKYLWIRARDLSGDLLPDKTNIGKEILEKLRSAKPGTLLLSQIPDLYIFGLSIITEFHLQILQELGKQNNVHFYLLNPAPLEYWFDDKSEKLIAFWERKGQDVSLQTTGNSLLTNWGRLIQNTFNQLFNNDELLNSYYESGVTEPPTDTLLHKIQNDIFHNRVVDRNEITDENLRDNSIVIVSCYTIAREVEVLYNYLVNLVDEQKQILSPRDIVVMVTDINAYAPYIKASFDNSPYPFPVTIADESYTGSDTVINALSDLLHLDAENFKAEEVMQLLDSFYIKKRFGITDIALLRKITDAANIRFGIEGNAIDETKYVSWDYGLKRILYGLCMSGDDAYNFENEALYPLDMVEGADSLQVIRFLHFISVLMDFVKERKIHRTLTAWVAYIEQLLNNMVCDPEEEVNEEYSLLMSKLESLNEMADIFNEEISFEIFRKNFAQTLSATLQTGTFSKGGITFCSLIPMRSIPFKVVAMLGLSYDTFPRKDVPVDFSLMERDKRKTDRNVKDNDKHLFLETLLSAKDYLYISYIGRKPQDNSVIPPSVLVEELVDYIESGSNSKDNNLVTQHPLHSYSKIYERQAGFYNYRKQTTSSVSLFTGEVTPEPFVFKEIRLDDLIRFFKNPFKEYYKKVLGISYSNYDLLLHDTEMFDLEKGLDQWQIKNALLHTDTNALNEVKDRFVKSGKLPLKNMALVAFNNMVEEMLPVKNLFNELTNGSAPSILNLSLIADDSALSGNIENVYGEKIVRVSLSKKENKYLIEAAILYFAATAAGHSHSVHFISQQKGSVFNGRKITKAEAANHLDTLVKLYKRGHERMLAFFPEQLKISTKIKEPTKEDFIKTMAAASDNFDEYLSQEYMAGFFEKEGIFEEYNVNTKTILNPVMALFEDYYKIND